MTKTKSQSEDQLNQVDRITRFRFSLGFGIFAVVLLFGCVYAFWQEYVELLGGWRLALIACLIGVIAASVLFGRIMPRDSNYDLPEGQEELIRIIRPCIRTIRSRYPRLLGERR